MKVSSWSAICGTRKERMTQQLLSSRAIPFVRKYVLHYKGFRNYCKSKGIVLTLLCDSILISEYLSYLQDAKNRILIESSKRLFGRPIKKKEPVTPEMIYRICLAFARVDSNLKDLRSALLFVLGSHDLFRISELLDLQAANVIVHNEYLEILVKSSKNDQYREGNKVFISKTGGNTCPTLLFVGFFASEGIDTNSSVHVFRAVRFFKKNNISVVP